MTNSRIFDYVLVGGGLHNSLVALALHDMQPNASVVLIEKELHIGGNHTWCFHEQDIPEQARPFVEPMVSSSWPGYEVIFPRYRRQLDSRYEGLRSEDLDSAVIDSFERTKSSALLRGAPVSRVAADHVILEDGSKIEGRCVFDARGPDAWTAGLGETGYQKFLGIEVELTRPHGLERPILMDASVPQADGFTFFYVLPLTPDTLLVELTFFSDTPDLDGEWAEEQIEEYAIQQGWSFQRALRRERGSIPLPVEFERPPMEWPLIWGYSGGWFHPATGYSFPIAVNLAVLVGRTPLERVIEAVRSCEQSYRRSFRFALRLNGLLFRWFRPEHRVGAFERFYRNDEEQIKRFYALRMSGWDRMRLMIGRPPRGFSVRARLGRASRLGR